MVMMIMGEQVNFCNGNVPERQMLQISRHTNTKYCNVYKIIKDVTLIRKAL